MRLLASHHIPIELTQAIEKLRMKRRFFFKRNPTSRSRLISRHPSKSSAESPHPKYCRARMTMRIARRRGERRTSRNSQNAKRGRSASAKKNSASTQRSGKGYLGPLPPIRRRNGQRRLAAMVVDNSEARAGVEEVIVVTLTPIPRPISHRRVVLPPPSGSSTIRLILRSPTRHTCNGNRKEVRDPDQERLAWISPFARHADQMAAAEEDLALPLGGAEVLLRDRLISVLSVSGAPPSRTKSPTQEVLCQILPNAGWCGTGTASASKRGIHAKYTTLPEGS